MNNPSVHTVKIQFKVLSFGIVLKDFPNMLILETALHCQNQTAQRTWKQTVKNHSVLPPNFFVGWNQKRNSTISISLETSQSTRQKSKMKWFGLLFCLSTKHYLLSLGASKRLGYGYIHKQPYQFTTNAVISCLMFSFLYSLQWSLVCEQDIYWLVISSIASHLQSVYLLFRTPI